MMRCILDAMLRQLGVDQIVEAEDGVDALTKLEKINVDFIISDWNMPKMSGLDFLKEIRRTGPHASTPFIMISSESGATYTTRATHAGADRYLVKPLSPFAFEENIRAILRARSNPLAQTA